MGFRIISFVFAFPAFYTIDIFGRRNLLPCTSPLMAIFPIVERPRVPVGRRGSARYGYDRDVWVSKRNMLLVQTDLVVITLV